MEERKVYRSSLRTKRWIREAFLQLLREKSFEKITVTDIANRAGINRSTFYAHYTDVFAIVEEIRNEVLETALAPLQNCDKNFFVSPEAYVTAMANLMMENRELYKLLGRTDVLRQQVDQIKAYLVHSSIEGMKVSVPKATQRQLQLRATLFVGGIVDVCMRWINGELDCSLEDIKTEVGNLISECAPVILELGNQ